MGNGDAVRVWDFRPGIGVLELARIRGRIGERREATDLYERVLRPRYYNWGIDTGQRFGRDAATRSVV